MAKPKSLKKKRSAPKKAVKKRARHLYLVQLSADVAGYEKPATDASEHKQFVFAVEATNDLSMLNLLHQQLKAARQDKDGALARVDRFYIDWIIRTDRLRSGLCWEYSISTEVPGGASELFRSYAGVDEWESVHGDSLFADFSDEATDAGSA